MQSAGLSPDATARDVVTREDLLKAVRSPEQMAQVLRARWQLRRCTSVAKSVRVRGKVSVQNYGHIDLANRVRIDGRTVPVELVAWSRGVLSVGEGTFLNYGVSLSAHTSVSIGKHCLLGDYVHVMDSDFHDLYDHTLPGKTAPIVIEDNVWLATRCIVLKGVTIGRGSVVGAGSVVTDDIPPMSLAFGVPARVVREL